MYVFKKRNENLSEDWFKNDQEIPDSNIAIFRYIVKFKDFAKRLLEMLSSHLLIITEKKQIGAAN